MSFLERVAAQARAPVPDIPAARPKGLLPGLLSAAGLPIPHVPPAPIAEEPRLAPSPVSDAAPDRASQQPAAPPPPARPVAAPAPSPVAISAPTESGAEPPPVVERLAPPPAAAEASASQVEPPSTPPDAKRPDLSALAAAIEPAFDPPDPEPVSRPVFEIAGPRHAPQPGPPPGPRLGPAEPPGLATQVADDAGTTPGEPIDRAVALRVEPPQRGEGPPIREPEAPVPADRPIGQGDRPPIEVLPIAQPLPMSPPPLPAERALPSGPAAEAKPPLLQIDQIDVLVTDPAPAPVVAARSPLSAVAASRRYLRRL